MTELLLVGVIAVLVIAAAAVFGPRLGIAAPLVLVAVGIGASFVPGLAGWTVDPEWILAGVLPPLLYASAVAMPAMNFRREFGAIGGLSVVLVVGSAVLLGLFFAWVIPGLGLAWGIALGAIISPTDAVATSIVKQTSVSRRVVAILDGESLLNDATALVLLRTATAAVAVSFSFWGAVGTFAWSVAIAVAIGLAVGWLNLAVRSRISDSTVNTAISFAVPFVAALPTEHLGGSGLVAAVVAGLVTGVRGARVLPPRHRVSDKQNWGTVELVLEGAVFLVMGFQITRIVGDLQRTQDGVLTGVLIAIGALLLTILIRAAYVVPLLFGLSANAKRGARMQDRLQGMQHRIENGEASTADLQQYRPGQRRPSDRDMQRFGVRLTRLLADIRYFTKEPMGWREGTTIVWAGMRGAVTVAAAQTIDAAENGSEHTSLLVFIAFAVALLSLGLQGGTIGPLVRWISPPARDTSAQDDAERTELFALMRQASESVGSGPVDASVRADVASVQRDSDADERAADADDRVQRELEAEQQPATASGGGAGVTAAPSAAVADGTRSVDLRVSMPVDDDGKPALTPEYMRSVKEYRLAVLGAQRKALLDARDDGTFDADVLETMLTNLDAEQIAMEMRGGPRG